MARFSGLLVIGFRSKTCHRGEHGGDRIGVMHLLGHLALPGFQEFRCALIVIA